MNELFLNSCNRDFIHRLNEMEKKFKKDCQSEIERCELVARLRQYLEKVSIFTNIEFIENIPKQIRNHLQQCMKEDLPLPVPQTVFDRVSGDLFQL
jgi:uncharacterized protein YnzC (UPF0291/DUF896 family)